ncbi:acyltransferase family protein [Cognatiluteimonas weifangensis]
MADPHFRNAAAPAWPRRGQRLVHQLSAVDTGQWNAGQHAVAVSRGAVEGATPSAARRLRPGAAGMTRLATAAAVSVPLPAAAPTPRSADRIGFLDGFRAVAILAVLGFHYYARYADDPRGMYPFGDAWSGFPPFEYGYYGVHLFFAVSGFVITLTLMRCETVAEFAVRRLARLWPTMLVCASLSYLFLLAFPWYFTPRAASFLPSLTFIDGRYFERLLPGTEFGWMDGAYWSLFVEIRFYALAAVLYFVHRTRFLAHTLSFFLLAVGAYWLLSALQQGHAAGVLRNLLILAYLPWFLFGIAAHCLWSGRDGWAAALAAAAFAALAADVVAAGQWQELTVAAGVCGLFWLCLRFAAVRRVFSMRWLTAIGVSSYSLYLLHQYIGVTLTAMLARAWAVPPAAALGLPVLTAAAMLLAAGLIYRYWESPLNAWIVRWYLRGGGVAVPAR